MSNFNLYHSHGNTKPSEKISMADYLTAIKNGRWKEHTEKVRAAAAISKEAGEKQKATATGATISGTFAPHRANTNLAQHSGFIAIDIDAKDNPDGIPIEELAADKYTYAIYKSIRGAGYVIFVRILPKKHLESFLGLEKYYANKYEIIIDNGCKDVSRFRYNSYDPDLLINDKSDVFKDYPKKEPRQAQPPKNYCFASNDVEYIISQIATDITNDEYLKCFGVGIGLAKEYGEMGRDYFHQILSHKHTYEHSKYDKRYTHWLKVCNTYVHTISFFFSLAKQAGLKLKTEKSTHIENTFRSRLLMVGENGGFKDKQAAFNGSVKYLNELDGIEEEKNDFIQIFQKLEPLSKNDLRQTLITGNFHHDLENIISSHYTIKHNAVTNEYELNGCDITNRDYNSMWRFMAQLFDTAEKPQKLALEAVVRTIESDFTPSYNPFTNFLNEYKELKPKGRILELLDCISMNCSEQTREQLNNFIKKWLLSIIASMSGIYSVSCLVLCGKQGKGKTEFFRNLLPTELRKYYAESKLDAGKDDEILMTKTLLILDDEFGGKSKQDEKKFKDYTSKQEFTTRMPYARKAETRNRYAVLCGATNEDEVINDPTGNRRIIPIPLNSINLQKFYAIDKTELFMELYHEYIRMGEDWKLTAFEVEILKNVSVLHQRQSEEEELLISYFDLPAPNSQPELMTASLIKNHIEQLTKAKLNINRIGAALIKLGFERKSAKIGGAACKCYAVLKRETAANIDTQRTDGTTERTANF